MHPSLKVYIECFSSPPFPKGFPRGGGIWEQDPILMRDFRAIRNYEVQWKETQERLSDMKGKTDPSQLDEGGFGPEDALNEMIEGLEDDEFF